MNHFRVKWSSVTVAVFIKAVLNSSSPLAVHSQIYAYIDLNLCLIRRMYAGYQTPTLYHPLQNITEQENTLRSEKYLRTCNYISFHLQMLFSKQCLWILMKKSMHVIIRLQKSHKPSPNESIGRKGKEEPQEHKSWWVKWASSRPKAEIGQKSSLSVIEIQT